MSSNVVAGARLRRGSYKRVPGEHYGTPKEVWGFRTAPARDSPANIARRFLTANADVFELEPRLAGLRIRRVIHSLGSAHVIMEQIHAKHRVHRGYVSVHLDRTGRVFLAKNRAVPKRLLPEAFEKRIDREEAVRRATRSLPKRNRLAKPRETELLWFPRNDKLIPTWKVRLTRNEPAQEWIVYLSAYNGAILNRYDNLAFASVGSGLIFDPSPVTALGDHSLLLTPKRRPRRPPPVAYRQVALRGLDGHGTLSGDKVTTKPTRSRVRRADLRFLLLSHEHGFEEVMTYYHVDAALRYVEQLGYRGIRGIFRQPIEVDANGTRDDNSWYSPIDRSLTFGTGAIDDAEDAETIVHELGHAIQDAICPDFGQSSEAAAMGEGFGDYFAASFFELRKPLRYRDSVMSWDGLLAGLRSRDDPPCLRRVDNLLTFENFEDPGDEHENGRIWSATLWEVRSALGREKADRLIVESHFQLDGFTTFARGARAILDADRNLERGKNRATLARIFRRRKIGPL